jgi:hypothetical protein
MVPGRALSLGTRSGRPAGGSGSGTVAWVRNDPAWAQAAGSRRDLTRLATVVTARITTITPSEVRVGICGTASLSVCPQCSTSLTPMKARTTASPVERYTSRVEQPLDQEEQCPQAQQGEGVGTEDQVQLVGDPENGRDGVEGDEQVGAADGDQDDEQGRDRPGGRRPG